MITRPPAVNRVVTAEQMRSCDRRATEIYDIPSLLLMENAGKAVYSAACEVLEDVDCKSILVIAGAGNNGGDGFVVARHLHNAGAIVTIAYYGDRNKAAGDALTNIVIAEKMGLEILVSPTSEQLRTILIESNLVIDALLGTGINGEVRKAQAEVIDVVNEWCAPVIAVDIPSGINADTGEVCGCAVQADITVTFALPKIGNVTYPGAQYCGALVVADISIPNEDLESTPDETRLILPSLVSTMIVSHSESAHKGTYGHVGVVAGSVGMTGAVVLACSGALRIGAGLVSAAACKSLNTILETKLTEAMTVPVDETEEQAFGKQSVAGVKDFISKKDVAVIGPGIGRSEETVEFVHSLVNGLKVPAVIDADALYAISRDPAIMKKSESCLVLTPHPGEMAMLTGTPVGAVQSNRLETARKYAMEHGVILVLKGAGTIVASPDGRAYINTSGTSAMATGGAGDVLSGMIAGLIAQTERDHGSCLDAAIAGVYLHGKAGELASDDVGNRSLIASDIPLYIGDALKGLPDSWACI